MDNLDNAQNPTPQDAQQGASPAAQVSQDPANANAPQIDPQAVAVAMTPTEGKPYEFGGKVFHLSYLSVAGQNALDKLLAPWMANSLDKSAVETMLSIGDSLLPAAALILSEQDPTANLAWVGGLKGRGVREKLFELVMDQVALDDMGKFYALLSNIGGEVRRVHARASRLNTPTI